jgi:serine/threonine protein kinase
MLECIYETKNTLCFISPYCGGKNIVESVLEEQSLLGVQSALHSVLQALADVHAVGLVHGDVKPSNLLYTE